MNATIEEEIAQLSRQEKLALIQRLWSMIDVDELPVPPGVVAELERRRANYERDPGAALTLDEIMTRVRRRL